MKPTLALLLLSTSYTLTFSFVPYPLQASYHLPPLNHLDEPPRRPPTLLPSYSFTKRRFDALSLITVSERTLLQYNSTNQSEPLR
jgi:hypothetical protein